MKRWRGLATIGLFLLTGCSDEAGSDVPLTIELSVCLEGRGSEAIEQVPSRCSTRLDEAVDDAAAAHGCLVAGEPAAVQAQSAPLRLDGGRPTLTDPEARFTFPAGARIEVAVFVYAGPFDGASCAGLTPDVACEGDCLLRLATEHVVERDRPVRFLDADGRCAVEHGPAFDGAERCNGADDDCDRLVDEGYFDPQPGADGGVGDRSCPAGIGACRRMGQRICGADGLSVVCDAVPGAPADEGCDPPGVDDDCDGEVDEGTPCGPCALDRPDDSGCAVNELCCALDGAPTCVRRDEDRCTACDAGCAPIGDTCYLDGEGRWACRCGDLGAQICADGTECEAGACIVCRVDDDCPGGDGLCCGGLCVGAAFDAGCEACGVGCDPRVSDGCVGRACLCGEGPACADDFPACDAGRCVECLDDADCPAERPACLYSERRCIECADDADCADGDRPVCVEGVCQECDSRLEAEAADCDEASRAPICLRGLCRACDDDGQCRVRQGPRDVCLREGDEAGRCALCDPADGRGCADVEAPICDADSATCRACEAGECPDGQQCTDGRCTGCPDGVCPLEGSRPICDPDDAFCRGCAADAECAARPDVGETGRAICFGGQCLVCHPVTHAGCAADEEPICAPDGRSCRACEDGAECLDRGAARPICFDGRCALCDPSSNAGCDARGDGSVCADDGLSCGPCAGDAQCQRGGLDLRCVDGRCEGCGPDAPCDLDGGAPVCGAEGVCAPCAADAECRALGRAACRGGRCAVCDPGSGLGCANPAPRCTAEGVCAPCETDAQCAALPGVGARCLGGECLECDPGEPLHCPRGAPICDSQMGRVCRACENDGECDRRGEGGGRCLDDGRCAECSTDDDCADPTPVCDPVTASCRVCQPGECAGDLLCVGGRCQACDPVTGAPCAGEAPICDVATGTCTPCDADAQCQLADPEAPVCVDGACAACDPTRAFDATGCRDPAAPICDGGVCRPCAGAGDCPDGLPCDGEACVGCVDESNVGCPPAGADPICDGARCRGCVEGECPPANAGPADAGRVLCVAGRCAECDPFAPWGASGCDPDGATPICGAGYLCQGCRADPECSALGPGARCEAGRCLPCDPALDDACPGGPCVDDGDCFDPDRPACDGGACVECRADDDTYCAEAPAAAAEGRLHCFRGDCVRCDPRDHAGCGESGGAPYCDVDTADCRPCAASAECVVRPGDLDHCVEGRCAACDPVTYAGCADPDRPVCDPDSRTCRGCAEAAECVAPDDIGGEPTECVGGRCVGCDPVGNRGCRSIGPTPICDPEAQVCRGCAGDAECPSVAPGTPEDADRDGAGPIAPASASDFCVGNQCRECNPDGHAGCAEEGARPICRAGDCGACERDGDCEARPGVADECIRDGAAAGRCALCDPADNAGCEDPANPVCDPETFTCRACDFAGECPPRADGRPSLCIGGVCTECDVDSNAGCDNTDDAPVCADDGDGLAACRACLDDGECAAAAAGGPDAARVQCVDGRCLACDQADNTPCDVGGPAPVCRRDVDGAFRCLPCAGDAECALVAPATPQCVGGGCEVCDPVGEGAFDDVGCAAPTAVCDEGIADCRGCMSDDECPGASLCRQNGTCSGCDPADGDRGCDPASATPVCDENQAECRGCADDAECAGNPQGELCVGGTCQPCDPGDHRGCELDTLCCGDGVPSCVPTTAESCAACDVACVGANRCVDRVCQCGDEAACGGLRPFCEGAAPAGRCVSCFTDDDCAIPGLGQCLDGACVACDPRVGEGAAGCAPDEGRPYCDPGIDACVSCEGDDDRCVEQVGRPECVGDSCFECDPDDPTTATGQKGCATDSDTPFCDAEQGNTCVGCGDDDARCLDDARTQCVGDGCFECDPRVLQGYAGCDPLSDAPFCAPDSSTCQACTVDRECDESPGGGRCVGDFCRVCDPGDHEGCNDDSLCCVDGIPGCRATDSAVECEACGVPCDPVTADNCTDRACRCGEAAACADGTPFCIGSACVECVADGDCGDGTICVGNVCRACDPLDNRNCVADSDAPVCDSDAFTCRGCGANAECDSGSGPATNVNGPICLDSGACRVCDPIAGDDQHEGCLADELCCPADGTPRCEDTAPDGQCEECRTACDPQVANRCADRSCVCGDTDAACDAEGDLPYCNGDDCVECIEDAHCGDGAVCVDFVCRACDPRDNRGCVEDSETPVCDGDDFVCRGCAANAECDGTSGPDANVNGPICLDSGACRVCDPIGGDDQHDGCEASELCCDADGTPECQATGPDAQCTACGEACPPRSADQCADRACACGDEAACADGTPYCVGGACEQCEIDADCDGDTPLCVDNVCVECNPGTGEGCDPDGDTPICGDDSTCRACQENPECIGNENGPTCLPSGRCRICDVGDHDGCGGEELCCEIGGAPRCQATEIGGACEACDDGICDPTSADACEGRLCVCGDTGAACADPNPFCVDGGCEECVADGDCDEDAICVNNACVECDPADDRGCDPDGVAPTCGGDFACGACGVDADCAANGNGPTCTDTGACRACDLADHDGCEDGELCCGADGAQACEATAFDGQCEACGERCDADAADACEGRACTCGGDPACAGGTPFCVDGACAECRDDADCGGGQCVAGVCGACDPAGDVGCDPDGAAPICGDDLTCRGCQGNLECVGNANGEVCVADTGACRTCDVGDHDGCGADELCCDQGGTPTCEATDPGAQCEVCGQTCDADAADTCLGRACTCGGAPACADGTPFCEGGGCVECRDGQGDCVGDPDGEICVAGVCEECGGDGDCPDGFCVDNACVECRANQGDCEDPEFCFSGSCIECVLTLNCDGGFVCQAGQCVCDEDADCGDAEVCCDGACQMDACDP